MVALPSMKWLPGSMWVPRWELIAKEVRSKGSPWAREEWDVSWKGGSPGYLGVAADKGRVMS